MLYRTLTPQVVPRVETAYRRIVTDFPVPESIPIFEQLARSEPLAQQGQPPVVWDRAEGFQVFDRWGNRWIDFTSGVLVANAGHSHPKIGRAINEVFQRGLWHHFGFASEVRAAALAALLEVAPEGLDKAYLLSTGSEAVECAVKLARYWGQRVGGPKKIGIVSFDNAFHGRTLGAQMAGGIPGLKQWIVNLDPDFRQVPFPDGFRCEDVRFERFIETLDKADVGPERIAAVITESYQGGDACFAPPEYIQQLREWCDRHGILLIFDEVQAGFGRSGRFWAFEHYDVQPDMVCAGKGISSGLPASAVLGRAELMDQFPPLSMTSTHAGNPLSAAAVEANIRVIQEEGLVEHSRRLGEILHAGLARLKQRFPSRIGATRGKGLVGALAMVQPGGIEPDAALADRIVLRAAERGLLMFAPVGYQAASVKISPPLMIDVAALCESIEVLEESIEAAV